MPPLTPLLRPGRFFAERELNALRLLAVLTVLLLALPLGVSTAGWVLTERVDGTVMVDNPNRPSESFCEGVPAAMDMGCDAPAEVERDIDTILQQAIDRFLGAAIVGGLISVALVGGLLAGGVWLFDAEGGGSATAVAVGLWGLLPGLAGIAVGVGLLWVLLEPTTVTPATEPATLLASIESQLAPLTRWSPVISGATTVWSVAIWRAGLREQCGLPGSGATLLAATVGVLFWLLSVV